MLTEYQERTYRNIVKGEDLVSFEVKLKETDLHIRADKELSARARELVEFYRGQIEEYASENPVFLKTFAPYKVKDPAPAIVKDMASASGLARVGPMASVAGALSEYVGKGLLKESGEVIVENGGDIFLFSKKRRRIAIFAGDSPFSMKVGFEVSPEKMPLGVCTSSGTVGPSFSFGRADAVAVLAKSSIVADAFATSIGNRIRDVEDIDGTLQWAREIKDISGVVIIKDDRLGVWGELELIRL